MQVPVAMSIVVAIRAFFVALLDRNKANAIRTILDGAETTQRLPEPTPSAQPDQPKPIVAAPVRALRNDAITLLATLQRESRLIDLIQEPLDQYSDAQVGAAARPCLTQCRGAIARIFELRPLLDQSEGQTVAVPESASPLRYQWVGDPRPAASSGKLVHPGWEATRCEIAQWTGSAEDANVVAPAQVEP
jgi:hypothetical protein